MNTINGIEMFFYQDPEMHVKLMATVKEASRILREERGPDMKVEWKVDARGRKSSVTSGDLKANTYIMKELRALNRILHESGHGSFNIISEENTEQPYEERAASKYTGSWSVDPLDGTSEYCDLEVQHPNYTCNIGLIVNGEPVYGIVSVPETGDVYYGIKGVGAYYVDNEGETHGLKVPEKDYTQPGLLIAVSSRHMNSDTKKCVQKHFNSPVEVAFSSSLKLLAVAKGDVHAYPRCGPTCEWDTCAADAVVRAAGGHVYIYDPSKSIQEHTEQLKYNKEDLYNPYFLVL